MNMISRHLYYWRASADLADTLIGRLHQTAVLHLIHYRLRWRQWRQLSGQKYWKRNGSCIEIEVK